MSRNTLIRRDGTYQSKTPDEMRLRREQKTLSPVHRGEGRCSRNVF